MINSKLFLSWGIPTDFHEALEAKVNHSDSIKLLCKEWLQNRTPFCILSGDNGTGKTTLACHMLKEWIVEENKKSLERRAEGHFVKQSILYLQWLDEVRTGSVYKLLCRFGEYDMLIIDDLGVKEPTEGWREWIISLIDYRLDWKKRTVITTNCNSQDIQKYYGETMVSRILRGTQIKIQGKDRRIGG